MTNGNKMFWIDITHTHIFILSFPNFHPPMFMNKMKCHCTNSLDQRKPKTLSTLRVQSLSCTDRQDHYCTNAAAFCEC
ncbi:hypothetical protein VIGAN_07058600 [Vigna angularis var. angularis]|uniref:Uncharacterized protein n=1 Tax=Vigna angularis var. angularis TaxID=157739 RepID=A0A0S3SGF4_PHAAN|nr:hypothetical protein VIGAN_07058600 [Vigna angularis var. angularis]